VLKNKVLIVGVFLSCCFVGVANANNDVRVVRDPTKPPTNILSNSSNNDEAQATKKVIYQLNAVKIIDDNRLAIINDKKYVVGQKIGSSSIKSISSNNVLLASGKMLFLFDKKSNNIAKKGY